MHQNSEIKKASRKKRKQQTKLIKWRSAKVYHCNSIPRNCRCGGGGVLSVCLSDVYDDGRPAGISRNNSNSSNICPPTISPSLLYSYSCCCCCCWLVALLISRDHHPHTHHHHHRHHFPALREVRRRERGLNGEDTLLLYTSSKEYTEWSQMRESDRTIFSLSLGSDFFPSLFPTQPFICMKGLAAAAAAAATAKRLPLPPPPLVLIDHDMTTHINVVAATTVVQKHNVFCCCCRTLHNNQPTNQLSSAQNPRDKFEVPLFQKNSTHLSVEQGGRVSCVVVERGHPRQADTSSSR